MPRIVAAKNVPKKAPAKKRTPRIYKTPEVIPPGEILKDLNKKEWKLGQPVGKGGFGCLYLADGAHADTVCQDAEYVVKIEPKENGPLFVEQAFYQRACSISMVNSWRTSHKLNHLGVPKFFGTGLHARGKSELRFLVLERFGDDIWKQFLACKKEFTPKIAFTLAIQILDSLEYLHSTGYAHADIKSANILLGHGPGAQNKVEDVIMGLKFNPKVYLVDYGLASRFCPNGKHAEYKPDPKKAHDGTPEFTSIDAHLGVVPSRRSDLEILGYVIIQWLVGRLPWEDKISENNTDFPYVMSQKKRYMSNVDSLLETCFPQVKRPDELQKYLEYVSNLKYEEVPDYKKLKGFFTKAIVRSGSKADGVLDFSTPLIQTESDSDNAKVKSKKRKAANDAKQLPSKVTKTARGRKAALSSSGDSDSTSNSQSPPVNRKTLRIAKPKVVGKRPSALSSSGNSDSTSNSQLPLVQRKSPRIAKSKVGKRPSARSSADDSCSSSSTVRKFPKTAAGKKLTGAVKRIKETPLMQGSSDQNDMGEVFTRRKRKTVVSVATSETQTSPGVKKTAKIKVVKC